MNDKRKVEELEIKKSNNKKAITIIIIILLVFMVIGGSTYAYFLFTLGTGEASVNSVSDVSLSFSDNKENMNMDLIPTSRENALKGLLKEEDKCIDIYGFSACSLYEFTITNESDVSQIINISMSILENEYESLEYSLYQGKINDLNELSIPVISNQELEKNSLLPITFNNLTETILANDNVSYTLMFYILNKDENQVIDDSNKSFRANININSITTGQYIKEEING